MHKEKEYELMKSPKKSKTKYLIGAFLATAFLISNCATDSEKETNQTAVEKNTEVGERLTDDSGAEYTLIDNGDGTETAKYDDGRSVTFKRQEDGTLDYLAGTAGLIAGLAAGYYLFHGFQNKGTWDSARNKYTINEPLKRVDKDKSVGGGGGSSAVNKSVSEKASSAKSGFGSAGVRSSSSS